MLENFSFNYDLNYTYEDNHIILLEERLSFAPVISAVWYSIITFISLLGNCFLVWVLLRHEGLRSSPDWLLLHLTVSDLIFTVTLVPWTIDQIWGWILGEMACKISNWTIFLGLYSYMMFLTIMAIHRYVLIVYPVFAMSVGNRSGLYTHISSTVVWMISAGFSLPEAFFSGTAEGPNGSLCVSKYDSSMMEMLGYFIQIFLFFVVPLLVIAVCYTHMALTICNTNITSRNRHNTVCIIFSIAMGVFICWAPYNIFLFLYVLKTLGVSALEELAWEETWDFTYCVIHILAYSHCCLNPLIHIFGGRKFRKHLLNCFTRSSQGYRSHIFSNQSSFSGQTFL